MDAIIVIVTLLLYTKLLLLIYRTTPTIQLDYNLSVFRPHFHKCTP